jgi:23S rRNA pseudouridine1911/1915/1917 synthase
VADPPVPAVPEPVVVPPALAGERVDRAVALLTGWTRAEVQALVRAGAVLVDGRPVAKAARLVAGSRLEINDAPRGAAPPAPEPLDVDVRFEDDDVVVVAKPAGLVVHPAPGHASGTLVHGLLHRYPDIAAVGDPMRPGIVHRLDRDTSGLLVVARTDRAHRALVAQLAARHVEREYDALVWGEPDVRRGVVDAPIGRSTSRRTRMAVRDGGREARTAFAIAETFPRPKCSLLRCRLETGRTHQIRVHLAAIGHPVVGDALYGGARAGIALDRPFLHAARLAFDHPATGERIALDEPLPATLATLLDRLRAA